MHKSKKIKYLCCLFLCIIFGYFFKYKIDQKSLNLPIKISIIVPIYNVEDYLPRCLNSLINQTLKEIEIICVIDGSTDNSYKITKKYAKKDKRIKILNLESNKGVSVARNTGIKHAKGEYLGFIDADDFVDSRFFEHLYNNRGNYDLIKGRLLSDGIIVSFRKFGQIIGTIAKRQFILDHKIEFPQKIKKGEDKIFFQIIPIY